METKFKVGDKVICKTKGNKFIEYGKVYTVHAYYKPTKIIMVTDDTGCSKACFSCEDFELLIDSKTNSTTLTNDQIIKPFKTQAEIFQALLEGKKITANNGKNFIQMVNGFMKDQNGVVRVVVGLNPPDWTIYEEAPVATEPEMFEVYQWRVCINASILRRYWDIDSALMTKEEADKKYLGCIYEPHAGPFYVTKPKEVK